MEAATDAPQSRCYHPQGLRLHFTDWGTPQTPPLLLVHGGLDHSSSWDHLARVAANFHVVAPDLRGRGDSEWATGSSYSLADHVYDLTGLVKAARFENVSGRNGQPDLCRCVSGKGIPAGRARRLDQSFGETRQAR
jgi:alpha-beta hydrolase superfamily lysophospholipase